jgi:hypothetical protein
MAVVAFNQSDAERIRNVVRRVERMPQSGGTHGRRHVVHNSRMQLCKPDQDIAAGDTDTVSIFSGFDRTDTSRNVEAYAIVAVEEDKWCSLEFIDGVYYVFKIEC